MTTTPGPAAVTSLSPSMVDDFIDEVKSFYNRHYANLTGTSDALTKLKFLVKDGYVWMLAVAVFLLFTAYKREKGKTKVAPAGE
jgi:hypothetical protein